MARKSKQRKKPHERTVGPGEEYYAYLKSDEWREVKLRYMQSKLPKDCYVCRIAWNNTFHFHHVTYKTLGCERLMDIVPVCPTCHNAIHDYHKAHPEMLLRVATKRMRRAHIAKLVIDYPSPEEIEAFKTAKGGFTKVQVIKWGVPWPLRKGWKDRLIRKYYENRKPA